MAVMSQSGDSINSPPEKEIGVDCITASSSTEGRKAQSHLHPVKVEAADADETQQGPSSSREADTAQVTRERINYSNLHIYK